QLYYQDQVCPTFSPQLNVEAEFYAQRVAMLVGGTWSGKYIDRETGSYVGPQRPGGLRYRMTNFPPGPSSRTGQRSTVAWGNMMVISRRCKHPEAAWQYIKLVAGLEGCLMRLKYIGQNAPRKDFYELRPEDMPPAWRQRGYPTWQEVVARKPYLATVPQICNSGGKLPSIERRATDRVFRRAYESVMLAANISRQQIRQRLDRAAAKVNRIYERSGFN
ncbi:MAG: extracellular solute-binding protein, partial [Phycisphaerae bacterium]